MLAVFTGVKPSTLEKETREKPWDFAANIPTNWAASRWNLKYTYHYHKSSSTYQGANSLASYSDVRGPLTLMANCKTLFTKPSNNKLSEHMINMMPY